MTSEETILIVPYRKTRGRLVPAEILTASNEASAERRVGLMAQRFAGVAAYAAIVEPESGDLLSPRLLMKKGEVPDLDLN